MALQYEAGLSSLWGNKAFDLLRKFVKDGDIEEIQVKVMAERMNVKTVYERMRSQGKEICFIFDEMLEKWYNEELFRVSPSEASSRLTDIMSRSRCSPRIVSSISNTLSHSVNRLEEEVHDMLQSLDLMEYSEVFKGEHFDDIAEMSDANLKNIGVKRFKHRKAIIGFCSDQCKFLSSAIWCEY